MQPVADPGNMFALQELQQIQNGAQPFKLRERKNSLHLV